MVSDHAKRTHLLISSLVEQEVHKNTLQRTSLKEQLQTSLSESQDLRTKLNSLGITFSKTVSDCEESEKSTGSSEISTLKSARTTLEETIARQKSRIETLETSHRDTLTLIEKKNGEISRNEDEYKLLQTKYIEARREISTTENALQEAQSQVSTLTYKEQSLQQEVDFLRKDNERLAAEVNTKSSDFATYRKEKVSPLETRIDTSLRKSRSSSPSSKKPPPPQIQTKNKIAC
jgi:chromosome segregation ATPase